MIKQNVIRTSLIFAISTIIFSHYSYAETSSNIESEGVDQKVNLQKTSDTQHSKIELSNENQNIKEFNHTNDETSNTEESQQESNRKLTVRKNQKQKNHNKKATKLTVRKNQQQRDHKKKAKSLIVQKNQ